MMKELRIDRIKLKGMLAQRQRQLAGVLGISENTLSLKINGKAKLHLDELNQIAYFLQIDTIKLLEEINYERICLS